MSSDSEINVPDQPLKRERKSAVYYVNDSEEEKEDPRAKKLKLSKVVKSKRKTVYVPKDVFSRIRDPSIQDNNSFNLPYFN